MAVLLSAKDIQVDFPAKTVFDCVTLGVNEGERIGIVGKNGDGKSTLLSILAGLSIPTSGEVIHSGSITIGTLTQTDMLNDAHSVEHAVVGDVEEYTWASDRRIREIIQELISDIPWEAQVGTLSGGQRRRVDLARLLIGNWDILMLDEPTNHLDMRAITWLAEHLKTRWPKGGGALLAVTHDRWFLDEIALGMWEVHDGKVDAFEGGYSAYILQRVERDRIEQVSEQKRKNLARKELAWLSRGARARSTKPKFHVELANELIADEPPMRNCLELKQAAMTRLGKQVLELVKVSESFDEKLVLNEVNWLIGPGDRYGILGENGAGKTTLLNIITGVLPPTSGTVKVGKTVKMAMLSQRLLELDESAGDRVREVLARYNTRLVIDGKSVTLARLLERLGFEREHLQTRVGDLSGGQRRRLQLLLTLADEPNVLILDEPGNDMDTDMLAVMEDLLDSWPGTLLIVSHDRYLMERVTDDQFALIDGTIRHVPGGVDEYLNILENLNREKKKTSLGPAKTDRSSGKIANESLASTQQKPLSGGQVYQSKKDIASIERKIDTLEKHAEQVRQSMRDADPSDYLALGKAEEELREVNERIHELENNWMLLSEQIEQS